MPMPSIHLDPLDYVVIIGSVILLVSTCLPCPCRARRAEAETPEQRAERVLAELEARAAAAEAVLREQAAAAPPVLMALPYFPYAGGGGGGAADETTTPECSICLEPLQQYQLCSEVPVCRHVFHRECLGAWARSNGSCPLCRAKIVPGTDGVAAADDMV